MNGLQKHAAGGRQSYDGSRNAVEHERVTEI